jgi:hypothetical protein
LLLDFRLYLQDLLPVHIQHSLQPLLLVFV